MNEQQEKIKKSLELIKNVFNKFNIDFMVTGSLALSEAGFRLRREPHDIDIEVIKGENFEQVKLALSLMSELNKSNYYEMIDLYTGHKPYVFEVLGIQVNVWLVNLFEPHFISDGYKFKKFDRILKYKMSYGREKDKQDIIHMISQLFSYIDK